MFDITKVARKNILELSPYRCARDDYSDGVLLDANENSIGACVKNYDHLQLNRYPDPLHYELKEPLARLRNVRKEQIFLGVGSDEAIDILFRIFCDPGQDNVVLAPPTYGMYKVCAKVNDVAIKVSPLTPEFDLDVSATLAAMDSNTKLVFITSPGNPTSKVIPNEDVEKLCKGFQKGIIVVDEAYIDFSGTPSACELISRYPNIVVLQTLSKAFGLAGIRLGMAFGRENIIQLMNNVKAPYNINKLTAEVALGALQDLTGFQAAVKQILRERAYLEEQLRALSFVQHIYHSDANFILFRVADAQRLYKTMADNGVVCRYRGNEMHCNDCLRLTVGTREENDKFLQLLTDTVQALGSSTA